MGTLGGHVLPGTFFIIFGIWWSFITSMRFILSKKRSPFKKNELIGYRGSVTMPCVVLPCRGLRSAPIESWIKLIFGTIGLLGEVITGFHYEYTPQLDKVFSASGSAPSEAHHMEGMEGMEHHHHRRDLGHDNLPNVPVQHIRFAYENTQHITMYTAFILGSIVEILLYHRFNIPRKAAHVMGIIAFSVEAFLFANHLHSRHALDIHLHQLLVLAIYGCVLSSCLEAYKPNQVLFTYGRIIFTLLQGTWFWQVGFILYPPFDGWIWTWDHDSHNQMMIATGSFCWHLFFILIGLLIQLLIMDKFYKSSHRVRMYFENLIEVDDLMELEEARDDRGLLDVKSGEETKFFTLVSDDNDEEENVTFDKANSKNKTGFKEYKDSNSSNNSSSLVS